MVLTSTEFKDYLAEEVKKYKAVYVPVRAGFFSRHLVKKVSCTQLHPNPDDEFSMPEIGPNQEIIARYRDQFRVLQQNVIKADYVATEVRKSLIVQKV